MKLVRPKKRCNDSVVTLTSDFAIPLKSFSDEQIEKIKDSLTFNNPAYSSAKRFSPYSRIYVDPLITYYHSSCGYLHVPAGTDLSPLNDPPVEDNRITVYSSTVPKFVLELREDQKAAAESYLKMNRGHKLRAAVQLPTGKGKAQPLYSKVLTSNGFIKMGDIKVGMKVISSDGLPHTVTGVFPQGKKDVYEITFSDGSKVRCSDEHLWVVRTKNEKKWGSPYRVRTLKEMMRLGLRNDRSYNLRVPLCSPVHFSTVNLPIHPYVVGCLIGDGCMTNAKEGIIYFSNTEQDVIDRLNSKLTYGEFVRNEHTQCQYEYRVNCTRKYSTLVSSIVSLGLDVYSEEKHIPEVYLRSSVEDRFELLYGLFDTDGCVFPNGSYTYSTTSHRLAEDIVFLCNSLGIRALIRSFTKPGYRTEYTVSILTHSHVFTSSKHVDRANKAAHSHTRSNIHRYDDMAVVDITYIGKEECQCIMVDSDDHTYITDSFVVTHNTVLALYLAAKLKQKTLVIVHKDDLVVGWQNDVDLCFNHKCIPGLIKAKSRKVGSFITIATAQTLSRMSEEELSKYLNAFGFVIMDELHHVPASMFDFVNRFTAKYRLGLTATPERKDGLAHVMKLYFGDFCYKYKSTGKEKDILPVTVIRRSADFLHIDPVCAKDERGRWFVKDFRIDPNSYKLKDGEQFISEVPYNVRPRLVFNDYSDMVVRRMKDMVMSDIAWEYYQGHSCIVFFSLKSQVDDFAEYLHQEKKIPVCDIHKYYGNNSAKENNRVMKEVENRRQGVTLTTYSKTSEGTNVRQWEVAFLVSSINDAKNTEQVVGRVRRVKEGCKLPMAVVYDYRCPFVYSLASHALTRDARYRKLGAQFANSNDQKERKSRGHSARMFTRGYVR